MSIVVEKVKKLWHSLPPKVQATIVFGASAAGTFLGQKLSQWLLDPAAACWHWSCLRHTLAAALAAGIVAGRAFFMRPGPGPAGAALPPSKQ